MTQSKIERALIAIDQRGIPIILATDGEWLAADCENISTSAEDVGLCDGRHDFPEGPGLYLFTGQRVINSCGPEYEPEVEWEGTIRSVSLDEIDALYAMKPPEPPFPEDDREIPA